MEYEVRFYFSYNKLDDIIKKLRSFKELESHDRSYEKTIQYDNSDLKNSFYSKEIDGRFRIRVTRNSKEEKYKLSWKRRIKDTTTSSVNKEEEVEVTILPNEFENFMYIIDNVLKMKLVESYERYRSIYTNEDIEISIDEYSFGIALEIENKSMKKDPEEVVFYWTNRLGLDIKDAYRLSWDDKYSELCKQQGYEHYNNVFFDLPMPSIKE